jgi:hypothetical protein
MGPALCPGNGTTFASATQIKPTNDSWRVDETYVRVEVIESAKRIHRKPDRKAKRAVASRQFNQIGDGMRDFFWIQRRRGEPLKKFLDISLAGS